MKKSVLLLAALVCAFVLAGCGKPAAVLPTVPDAVEPGSLAALLSMLQGSDIGLVGWRIDIENKPAAEEVAERIRAAMAHPVDAEQLTLNGSKTDVVWTLDLYMGDPDAPGWSGDDALHLYAGLSENVVELFGGVNLPEGRCFVEDEALYQLVRTSMDRPDGEIDRAAYEIYRAFVEDYLAQVPDYGGDIAVEQELLSFTLNAQNEALGAEIYTIGSVLLVDPAEEAMRFLAGGAYVDSQLRIHGEAGQNQLVVVDGKAIGFASWELAEQGGLERFATKEALIAAVQGGKT